MKVKIWGCAAPVPAPGPETTRYGGNTSCVQVTLSDGTVLALDAGTGIRSLGLSMPGPSRINILLTHLHLDHIQGLMFFAPAFRPSRRSRSGGRSPRRRRSRIGSPATSRPAVPSRDARASMRRLVPRRARGRVGDRLRPAHPGRVRQPPWSHPRLPRSRRAMSRSATSPTTSLDWARPEPARARVDLRVRAGPGRVGADPRLPVHRRRVPRPRGLGPFRRDGRTDLRPPRRRTPTILFHHDPLHSDDALDRLQSVVTDRWTEMGADPKSLELAVERREIEVEAMLGSSARPDSASSPRGDMSATGSPRPASRRIVAILRPG